MHPQPIFYIFGQGIYLYGICFALGLVGCFAFLMFVMAKKKFNDASSNAILFIGIFGTGFGVFSAMLFQAVYDVIANPEAGFQFGGMTFIGGLIGGVVSFVGVWNIYTYAILPRTKIKMNAGLCDALPFIPIAITIAHAFGRFGCFWAGCCHGKETDAWYGLPCGGSSINYIPTQLFEMFFLILLGVIMAILYFKFKFNYNFALYAIAYGIWRFCIEFLRGDYRGSFIGDLLSPSQFWSIIMVILGVGYIFVQKYFWSKLMKHPENTLEEEKENPSPENA